MNEVHCRLVGVSHGLQLTQLAAKDRKVGLVRIIKEAGDDNANVLEFYENYFNYPLYKDDKWHVYKAMGGRTLTMDTLKAGVQKYMPRYKSKGIPMRFDGGDRFMMGGILIFDRKGNLCFSYNEVYGEELDIEVIEQAIAEVRADTTSSSRSSSYSRGESSRSLLVDEEQRFF